MSKVTFHAGIKQIVNKQLVSGDCAARIVLDKDSLGADQMGALHLFQSMPENASQQLKITIEV